MEWHKWICTLFTVSIVSNNALENVKSVSVSISPSRNTSLLKLSRDTDMARVLSVKEDNTGLIASTESTDVHTSHIPVATKMLEMEETAALSNDYSGHIIYCFFDDEPDYFGNDFLDGIKEDPDFDTKTQTHLVTSSLGGQVFSDGYYDKTSTACYENLICGYRIYIEREICNTGNASCKLPLFACQVNWRAILFGIMVGTIGLSAIVVNGLILAVFIRNTSMRSQHFYIKASLAVADSIVGFLMLLSVLPNMVWLQNITAKELQEYLLTKYNSSTSIMIGSLLLVSIQNSLLHLLFLSVERFIAIKWSLWHLGRKTRTIVMTLVALWIVSFMTTLIPVAFPNHFQYQFHPPLLIHMLSIKNYNTNGGVAWQGPVYTTFALLFPYVVTVVFCISTAVISIRKVQSSKRFFKTNAYVVTKLSSSQGRKIAEATWNKKENKSSLKQEIAIFVTVVTMIVTFSVTFLPFGIVSLLLILGVLNCDNYMNLYVVTFYIGLLNSFSNGIIYSICDIKFRHAVCLLFYSNYKKRVSASVTERNSGHSRFPIKS